MPSKQKHTEREGDYEDYYEFEEFAPRAHWQISQLPNPTKLPLAVRNSKDFFNEFGKNEQVLGLLFDSGQVMFFNC